MATSSASAQDSQDLSTPPPTLLAITATGAASRRLPPPCWSPDETVALIDAYCSKWYSLRRGNLRANHWQEVADDVGVRCPINPSKTAVQCRHKMEKLRKRYRQEIARAAPYGGVRNPRFISAWVHFKRMDAMERGPDAVAQTDEEEYDREDLKPNIIKHMGGMYQNNNNRFINNPSTFQAPVNNGGNGFRIRLPARAGMGSTMATTAKIYRNYDGIGVQTPNYNPNPSSQFEGSSKVLRDGYNTRREFGKRVVEERKKADPISEMVGAIKSLGEGFVRMERMKMDMAQEVEQMRMEMEIKRTEMILESQQQIVEAFANAISERKTKKAKRIPNPES